MGSSSNSYNFLIQFLFLLIDWESMWLCLAQFQICFNGGRFKCCLPHQKQLQKLSRFAGVWNLLLERNNQVFCNKSNAAEKVVDSII